MQDNKYCNAAKRISQLELDFNSNNRISASIKRDKEVIISQYSYDKWDKSHNSLILSEDGSMLTCISAQEVDEFIVCIFTHLRFPRNAPTVYTFYKKSGGCVQKCRLSLQLKTFKESVYPIVADNSSLLLNKPEANARYGTIYLPVHLLSGGHVYSFRLRREEAEELCNDIKLAAIQLDQGDASKC